MKSSIPSFRFFYFLRVLMGCWTLFSASSALAQKPTSSLSTPIYFPPTGSPDWEKMSIANLGWNQTALAELLAWLPTQDTRAFIVLKDGKIVVEEYWGSKLTGVGNMDQNSYWYWASAGKTLTAAMVGLAEEDKLLSLNDRTQKYLGKGWTSMPDKQERNIRLVHHLTMTTGIDDKVGNLDDTSPASFKYLAKPGTRWSYHNATYTVLEKVIEKASGKGYQAFFEEKIGSKIGMRGFWQKTGLNNVFYSDARSFARFGLLMLSGGNWNGIQIWSGDFFENMHQSSQDINLGYGYLTWLNGKSSFKVPGSQISINGSMIPQAPADMYQAIGKNGQFLMIIPSMNLVIVRMGTSSGDSMIPFALMREIWQRLDPVIR